MNTWQTGRKAKDRTLFLYFSFFFFFMIKN
jgi:hypothetical protein